MKYRPVPVGHHDFDIPLLKTDHIVVDPNFIRLSENESFVVTIGKTCIKREIQVFLHVGERRLG